ncbi:MAG: hypothetical protein TREMPRED_005754 [Tremellales sp. Tagirdzhanova-0007]|nr:MAG: hypothetical protein TREMPRED_005754 [Tremellales sp. Tagirdzhanova-0007]
MPNRLIKVMSYDVETHESPISIRLSGCCYLGDELVECSALGLGEGFGKVITCLGMLNQIFFGLLLFSCLLSILFRVATKKMWYTWRDLLELRLFVICSLVGTTVAGLAASTLGLALLFYPVMAVGGVDPVSVQVGGAELITICLTLCGALFELGFANQSKGLLDEVALLESSIMGEEKEKVDTVSSEILMMRGSTGEP